MPQIRNVKRYGWIPDLPDHRDRLFSALITTTESLPSSTDLRAYCPDVYNQGDLGSCTAQAIGAAVQFGRRKQKLEPDFVPSSLFIYYNERRLMGDDYVNQDSGAYLRDGMKTVANEGVCPEDAWPYDIERFTEEPPAESYKAALENQVLSYQRLLQTATQLKACLAAGYPFVFGFSVYESFESAEVRKTGIVPMPKGNEAVLGGHAVMAVGYDDDHQRFIVRNSWGTAWGDDGYCYMPYAYLIDGDLSADFWTVRLVES